MVTEYIKRNQKMGYDGDKLIYKVYLDEESPVTPDVTVPYPGDAQPQEPVIVDVVEEIPAPVEGE